MSLIPADHEKLVDLGHTTEENEEAALAASARIREAMGRWFAVPETLEGFGETAAALELRALVLQHGLALAQRDVSIHDGQQSRAVAAAAARADTWLALIIAGSISLTPPLPRVSASGPRQLFTVGTSAPLLPAGVFDQVVPSAAGAR